MVQKLPDCPSRAQAAGMAILRGIVRESVGQHSHPADGTPAQGSLNEEIMKKHSLQRGFTLMELMVVIIIVAILAAVAVPLYINYVKDAKRTEAKGAIAAIISAEQIYFQQNDVYIDAADKATIESALRVDLSDVGNWGFEVSGAGSTGFTVEATGSGPADGLIVRCIYVKGATPQWEDETTP